MECMGAVLPGCNEHQSRFAVAGMLKAVEHWKILLGTLGERSHVPHTDVSGLLGYQERDIFSKT